jgi:hypothetical protein
LNELMISLNELTISLNEFMISLNEFTISLNEFTISLNEIDCYQRSFRVNLFKASSENNDYASSMQIFIQEPVNAATFRHHLADYLRSLELLLKLPQTPANAYLLFGSLS